MLAFASCKKGTEDAKTTATTVPKSTMQSTKSISTTNAQESTAASSTEKQTTSEKSKEQTTSQKTTAKAKETVPITVNEALDRLSSFYGSAYNVNATVKEGFVQYFKITDKKDNLYARVKVDLKTSKAIETIEHSGEVNEFYLSA
jgi:hypothetical protein